MTGGITTKIQVTWSSHFQCSGQAASEGPDEAHAHAAASNV